MTLWCHAQGSWTRAKTKSRLNMEKKQWNDQGKERQGLFKLAGRGRLLRTRWSLNKTENARQSPTLQQKYKPINIHNSTNLWLRGNINPIPILAIVSMLCSTCPVAPLQLIRPYTEDPFAGWYSSQSSMWIFHMEVQVVRRRGSVKMWRQRERDGERGTWSLQENQVKVNLPRQL